MLIVHEVLARVGRQCFPKEVSHYAYTPRPQLGDDILSSSHGLRSFTYIKNVVNAIIIIFKIFFEPFKLKVNFLTGLIIFSIIVNNCC